MEHHRTDTDKKITDKEAEWNKNHSLILELKARIDIDSSQNNFSQSSYFFHEKDYDYYITSFLNGVKFKVYHHTWMLDKFPENENILTQRIISDLKRFLQTNSKISIPTNLSNYELTELCKEIRKINNDKVDNLISIIYSKLISIENV